MMERNARMKTTAIAMALTLCLGACGGGDEKGTANTQVAKPKAPRVIGIEFGEKRKLSDKPMTTEEVTQYHVSVESAMDAIPPAMRADFQKAFECQATKNGKLPPADQIEMDGDWIVKKTGQLKSDRETAIAC
jgi:hypothetical protein